MMRRSFLLLFWLLWGVACTPQGGSTLDEYCVELYTPHYASGFSVLGRKGAEADSETPQSTLIRVKNPWQGAEEVERTLFIARGGEQPPTDYRGPVLWGDAKRVACFSSSYVAMLDAVGGVERIVGVSGLNYIHNEAVRQNHHAIGDVGYDGNVNYELLVALDVDLVLLYGVFGPASMEPKLKELGIPCLYVGEYVEQSPLGKAEWMIPVAEAVGLRPEAEARFATIPPQYEVLRELAATATHHPKVMLNTPYADSWLMPWRSSYTARLVADAGGDYLFHSRGEETGSQRIDLEEAALLTAEADIWLDVSNVADRESLIRLYPRFANLKCVQEGEVWNNDLRSKIHGGNDFWESGVVNPHLILRDMIKIFHPELVKEEFYYYRKL